MIGYLIDPYTKTVTPVEFHDDKAMLSLIDGGCGCDTTVVNKRGDRVLTDAMVYSRDERAFFNYGRYHWPVAGKAFLFGCDRDGQTRSVVAGHDEVLTAITWGKR